MAKKPVLVIMAAGMGSRYGGLKQIDPIDPQGHLIIDFSLYDALKAGFEEVIFLIKPEIEEDFKERIGNRMEKHMQVRYAYQTQDALPEGFACPEGRTKPFGTGHAVLCCAPLIEGPFAVINADDYYGTKAYKMLFDYLTQQDNKPGKYAMVGYQLENTLTDHGHVARGVCVTDSENFLLEINERVHIEKRGSGAAYTEDDGKTFVEIPENSTASMNLWGFSTDYLQALKNRFPTFLEKGLLENPLKCEYFLPTVVNELLEEKECTVQVLQSPDRWYGVTYHEDKAFVEKAIQDLKAKGLYPQNLWEE